jgi:hypothetical protein
LEKTCVTCFYNLGKKCKILHEKTPKNCSSWADEPEARRREEACAEYNRKYGANEVCRNILPADQIEKRQMTRKQNQEARGGKSVKETLDEHFNWYYLQGLSDSEIAKNLYMDVKRVSDYRRDHSLPAWKERNRPTAMETAS